jgi:hypothetical protein
MDDYESIDVYGEAVYLMEEMEEREEMESLKPVLK